MARVRGIGTRDETVDWSFFAQLLLNGLVIGVIYALIAMGLSLIFGVLEIVNFAHGEFYMLGAMLAYFLTAKLGLRLLGDHPGRHRRRRRRGLRALTRRCCCRCAARASSAASC